MFDRSVLRDYFWNFQENYFKMFYLIFDEEKKPINENHILSHVLIK